VEEKKRTTVWSLKRSAWAETNTDQQHNEHRKGQLLGERGISKQGKAYGLSCKCYGRRLVMGVPPPRKLKGRDRGVGFAQGCTLSAGLCKGTEGGRGGGDVPGRVSDRTMLLWVCLWGPRDHIENNREMSQVGTIKKRRKGQICSRGNTNGRSKRGKLPLRERKECGKF